MARPRGRIVLDDVLAVAGRVVRVEELVRVSGSRSSGRFCLSVWQRPHRAPLGTYAIGEERSSSPEQSTCQKHGDLREALREAMQS